jgi:hypothetical protein
LHGSPAKATDVPDLTAWRSADIAPRAWREGPGVARGTRLSEGLVVEASILARLLRIKLLKLDATILVVPVDAAASSTPPRSPRGREPAQLPAAPWAAGRGRLLEAVRYLDEGAELLARARRNRSLLRSLDAAR